MKHTSTVISFLFFIVLVAVNIQLTTAQTYTCNTVNCGAGELYDGGINSLTCASGSCWWNNCTLRAGNPCVSSDSRNCGYTLGCPNQPCTGHFQSCTGDGDCCNPYFCNAENVCAQNSPIMINLKNNSANYQLTSYTDGVSFDINGRGIQYRVGWTEPDSEVGILSLDRNGNGTIDNGSELFGNATKKRDGRLAANGFEALVDLDGGPENSDGKIDASDPPYMLLRLWLDDNHDGISQSNELVKLADAEVTTLFTGYRETPRMDRHGNLYAYKGSALVLKNGHEHRRRMFDVFLITAAPIQ